MSHRSGSLAKFKNFGTPMNPKRHRPFTRTYSPNTGAKSENSRSRSVSWPHQSDVTSVAIVAHKLSAERENLQQFALTRTAKVEVEELSDVHPHFVAGRRVHYAHVTRCRGGSRAVSWDRQFRQFQLGLTGFTESATDATINFSYISSTQKWHKNLCMSCGALPIGTVDEGEEAY